MATAQQLASRSVSTHWKPVFGATIFVSAFLLFQIEFILGKFLLPWFGGTSGVWATSMLCFQLALLAGYAYAHWVQSRANQGKFHLGLAGVVIVYAALRLALTGALPGPHSKPAPDADPIVGIILLFATAIGLQFFFLASTAPLMQAWYAQLFRREPYVLYALSNAGSLIALATYPLVFERTLPLRTQAFIWASMFLLYGVMCLACAWRVANSRIQPRSTSAMPVGLGLRLMWLALSAAPSALFLALTNHLTQDVAPIPLLWALPLAIYLLSFILVFGDERIYVRGFWHALFAITSFLAIVALLAGTALAVGPQIAIFSSWLFVSCMIAHGELARLKPQGDSLTSFYLTIATGGAIGGLFVAIAAPLLFSGPWELHIAAVATLVIAASVLWWDRGSWLHRPLPWLLPAMLAALLMAPLTLAQLRFKVPAWAMTRGAALLAAICILAAAWLYFKRPRLQHPRIAILFNKSLVLATMIAVIVPLVANARYTGGHTLFRSRNFYGALAVNEAALPDRTRYLRLVHGRIEHGNQLRERSAERYRPTSYFSEDSGAGVILRALQQHTPSMRVGTIGLGVGTLAAYARPGDVYRFYEINPTVIHIAEGRPSPWFDFVPHARQGGANVEIVVGDARLSLEKELMEGKRNGYDVFIVDAFNGDSIPVHLLTLQAMQLYLAHLRDQDSVIALHISNRAVDLRRIAAGFADPLGLHAMWISSSNRDAIHHRSDWVLLSRTSRFTQLPEVAAAGSPLRKAMQTTSTGGPVLWTDDFSNVWEVLDLHRDLTPGSPKQERSASPAPVATSSNQAAPRPAQ
jgi:hypothetical protein